MSAQGGIISAGRGFISAQGGIISAQGGIISAGSWPRGLPKQGKYMESGLAQAASQ